MKKRFSIKIKLLIIFGLLVAAATLVLGLLTMQLAKKAVTEKVETHLIDKATDTAEVIDGKVMSMFQFLEGLARMPAFVDESRSYREKVSLLKKEVAFNAALSEATITDSEGNMYTLDGNIIKGSDKDWFISATSGKHFVSEPHISRLTNKMIITFSTPIYDGNRKIIGALAAGVPAEWLTDAIEDIVIGNSGYCFILSQTGTAIAHKKFDFVTEQFNAIETAKTDNSFSSVSNLHSKAISSEKPDIVFYEYSEISSIASYAKMKTSDWTVIISAPVEEFMNTIHTLRSSIYIIGIIILITSLITVFFTSHSMVKPITKVVTALKDISQGEGDLTVRLPLHGNDEITDLSQYFNKTIEKISSSIKSVGENSYAMQSIGSELSSNMTETASSINQISANIDGVKQQTMSQAASVTETAATVEQIIRTIKQLNNSIETQAASVAQSSSSVEQMVANIASITQTLEKSDDIIKELAAATADGKETLSSSNTVTQKIAEESGSLMEASSVIQHIASQTNLLAMNAAIEAAHAGDAGKGFAVVADEIRKLAEESSAQGKSITSTLKTLSGEIETLSASADTVEEKFNAIFSLAENVKEMSNRIMEAMREQENGSKEVLSAIRNINEVTVEVKAGSEEMLKGGEGVADEMNKLDGLTRTITDSMNEMASGAIQINNAVQEVNEITQKNKMSIEALAKEVGKFKV
ncbi:methyl-accepting chemotaxis protein [Treponema pedis]|uniref:Methyl-accepting chemotaxis protein n=4 Tax=Treponema pedis TaxID=409322 RepID=S6A3I3_9SPIR|nr:methyl-accepting chemotaxis protein [Treponema pedis]AGT43581.1 methyl-accepting chemotaxis protein [Treponema pedis str. T A4]